MLLKLYKVKQKVVIIYNIVLSDKDIKILIHCLQEAMCNPLTIRLNDNVGEQLINTYMNDKLQDLILKLSSAKNGHYRVNDEELREIISDSDAFTKLRIKMMNDRQQNFPQKLLQVPIGIIDTDDGYVAITLQAEFEKNFFKSKEVKE